MSYRSVIFTACIVLLTSVLLGCDAFGIFPEYNTQSFDAGEATQLSGKQLYFIARDFPLEKKRAAHYERFVSDQTTLPVDPANHQSIDFSQANPFALTLPKDVEFYYYQRFETLYIGSNGTIAFGTPSTGNGTLVDYFSSDQISLLPVDATIEGTTVRYAVYDNTIVITYENVAGSTFQCEFFLQGEQRHDIAVTYSVVSENTRAGVVGLALDRTGEIDEFLERFYVEANLTENSQFGNTAPLTLGF